MGDPGQREWGTTATTGRGRRDDNDDHETTGDEGANDKKAQETLLMSLGPPVSFSFLFSFSFHFTNYFLGTNLNYGQQGTVKRYNDERNPGTQYILDRYFRVST
jgi:hypothetical protein